MVVFAARAHLGLALRASAGRGVGGWLSGPSGGAAHGAHELEAITRCAFLSVSREALKESERFLLVRNPLAWPRTHAGWLQVGV